MRLPTLLITLLLLSGCNQDPVTSRLQDYAGRVSNAIEHDISLTLDESLPAYPAKRDRLMQITELREGLIDVLDLRRCGLLELIGERNSSLGKLALPSQRLIYEFRFMPPLRNCIQALRNSDNALSEDETELLERLLKIEQIKQENLPLVVANAVFNSEEVVRQFALANPAADTTELMLFQHLDHPLEQLSDLAMLSRQARWHHVPDLSRLEQSFEQLHQTHFGTAWLRSLSYLTQTLEQTATAMEQRLQQRPLCFNQRPTPQARIMHNVFQKYYAAELQPWMSAVHRNGQRWRQHWASLTEQLPLTPALRAYFEQTLTGTHSLWARYLRARDRHTRGWQELLRQCGMMPGR